MKYIQPWKSWLLLDLLITAEVWLQLPSSNLLIISKYNLEGKINLINTPLFYKDSNNAVNDSLFSSQNALRFVFLNNFRKFNKTFNCIP